MRHMKKFAVTAIGVVSIAIAATAVAFWTTSGGGSDTGTVGSVGALTVAVNLADGNHPGDGPTGVSITGTVTNNTTSAVSVTQVAGDPANAATHFLTVDASHASCNLTDFTLTTDPINNGNGPVTLAANGGSTPYTGHLVMAESGTNQNACQGAVLTLHLTAS